MADAFIGEIRAIGFGYVPEGWLECDGTVYNIRQFQALASLVGNHFGGDGRDTFGVPDLRGTLALGCSSQMPLGVKQGASTATLTVSQLASHTHAATWASTGGTPLSVAIDVADGAAKSGQNPAGGFLATSDLSYTTYAPASTSPGATLGGTSVGVSGGSAAIAVATQGTSTPFSLLPSYVAMRYIIAWDGVYPVRP
jgi:microcystin-dependent protein